MILRALLAIDSHKSQFTQIIKISPYSVSNFIIKKMCKLVSVNFGIDTSLPALLFMLSLDSVNQRFACESLLVCSFDMYALVVQTSKIVVKSLIVPDLFPFALCSVSLAPPLTLSYILEMSSTLHLSVSGEEE